MTEKTETQTESFEDAISELEKIVERMEQGDLPLEQALSLFERGVSLAKHSQNALDKAEQRVKVLVQTPQGEALDDLASTDRDNA